MSRYFYSSFAAKLFSTGCSFLSGVVSLRLFAEYLSQSEFLIYAVAMQVMAYVPLLDGGARMMLNRRLLASASEAEQTRIIQFGQKFYSWFTLLAGCVIAIVMAGYWFTPGVRGSGQEFGWFMAMSLTFTLLVASSGLGNFLAGLQAQQVLFWTLGCATLVNLAVLAVSFRLGLRLWAFPVANFAMFVASWPLYVWFVKGKAKDIRIIDFKLTADFWEDFRTMRREAFDSFRTQVSTFLLYTVDLVIVGVANPKDGAAYAVLARVFMIVRSFMQSFTEVSWPIMAKHQQSSKHWSQVLLRANAWLYGSVCGALSISLLPFLYWYMGPEWTGSPLLLGIMVARFVITGLQSPGGYYLISIGKFNVLAKWTEIELVAAVTLGAVLSVYGPTGVALGFLVSTLFGTLFSIHAAYAKEIGIPVSSLLGSVWARTLVALGASVIFTHLLLLSFTGMFSAVSGAVGAGLALLLAVLYGCFKLRRTQPASPIRFRELVSAI